MDREEVLRQLHNGNWLEELLGEEFEFTVERVLTPIERQILEHKVQEIKDRDICRLFKIKPSTLRDKIRDITFKFRNTVARRPQSS